ncbi:MAG: LytTR family DNA-binding domain-containing protein [Lachnospiraceae bacterium]|nr:LytTR family DNA-binding domain-containing protein [Lachnospiraceae bacterium]
MYQIAICDDDSAFASHLKDKITSILNQMGIPVNISVFTDSKLLTSSQHYDLLFLDIRMPDINGLEIANKIRQTDDTGISSTSIIFVSSLSDAVFESFRYSPLRFIRKEMLDNELEEALMTFHHLSLKKQKEYQIELTEKGTSVFIPVNSVYYVEIRGHYLQFVCKNNTYRTRSSLSGYEPILLKQNFVRIHQGCLVNLQNVEMIGVDYIILTDASRLNVARSCRTAVKNAYMKWEREHTHVLTV